MNWVLLIGAVWLAVAVFVGVLIGRGIRIADRKQQEAFAAEAGAPNFVVDLTPPVVAETAEPAVAETPATEATPEASTPETTPERSRHAIPKSRPAGVRAPVRASERTPSSRESGLS
jgi:hypothetical protein